MNGPSALAIRSVDAARASDGLVPRPRVVVVGVGHGGLETVQALAREAVDVLVVDKNNYHTFQPLLYQVATAGLAVDDVTQPARHLLRRQANVAFRMGTVERVDLDARLLHLDAGPPVSYDALVIAAGATTATFGVAGVAEHAFPLKSATEAMALRGHVLRQFEAAYRDPGLVDAGATTVAVVGGGATGVEMAGALRELFSRVLTEDFPGLPASGLRVVLVEGGPSLMAAYDADLQAYTRRSLERMGAEVRTGVGVTRVTPEGIDLADGTHLAARTVVWAAGVQGVPLADALAAQPGVALTRGRRVVVDETLRLPEHPEVFVVGDLAGAADASGALYPQVAQVAIQQGRHAAREIARARAGRERLPFRYRDLGMMATIGRNAAIMQLPNGFTQKGLVAWIGWLVVHVLALASFRNKVSVVLAWVYNYITYDRGPRLILDLALPADAASRAAPLPTATADRPTVHGARPAARPASLPEPVPAS